jgi:hypothetical protein
LVFCRADGRQTPRTTSARRTPISPPPLPEAKVTAARAEAEAEAKTKVRAA